MRAEPYVNRTEERQIRAQSARRFFGSCSGSNAKPILWTVMALAGISVLFSTEFPILLDKAGPNHLFYLKLLRDRYLFIPHALAGIVATFIGPMQFSTRLRRKHLQMHRFLGRAYAYAVLVAAVLAVILSWNDTAFVGTMVKATAWLLCTFFAVLAARNRYIVQHRQWMIRSYAITFTFVLVRLVNFWPAYANMSDATFNLVDITLTFVCVSVPTVAFDWRALTAERA